MILVEPVRQEVEELSGTFAVTKNGEQITAPFYVRCEPRPERTNPCFEEIKDRRNEAANSQLTDMWMHLKSEGYTDIHYKNVSPDPFI